MTEEETEEFYVRYYVGHIGRFGHEFAEFELNPDGKLRTANNSNYRNSEMIRKAVFLNPATVKQFRKIIEDSEIMREDDSQWPEPNKEGRQELEIVMGGEHISFTTSKIGLQQDIEGTSDPHGLRAFYYLAADLRMLVLSLTSLHFRMNPFFHR